MGSSIPHNIIPNGYELLEILHEGKNTLVYRARRLKEKTSVVIKTTPPQMALRFSDHLAFRNQFTIGQTLNHPGIIQILALEPCHQTYALVMEDVQWTPLSEMLQSSISLKDGLTIALQLADILHYLGQQRVLHKDIKPGNILLHPQTLQVKLIDFGIASLLPKETQEIKNPNALEGTLAYIAPEQTGRMNRGIDFRSDFYSLGVTLFELFAGQLPFQADEPVVWLHCHIAQIPPSLTEFGVPGAVANLVAKLLAKNAEDRYQSALGLKHDLELCLTQVTAGEEIEPFKLGLRDVCDRFLIPEKLYGRKAEVKTLLDAFDRVAQGSSELMLVAGFSGIGKTAVINEVHKPITQKKGYFIKGKFDQFNRNIPFSAFVQAFRSLMGQLLGESDSDLAHWKTRVLEVVGESGQVLIDVIPELEHIIGKQPTVPELRNRRPKSV
ncbi:serine/threonine-protein kinase [Acaryochloris marina]|uniref:serine/threonine-protein kinase n=1 Tax=Acaryochloris marina TaxID=155978 RepID=UPI001BAE7A58|nr:serine/threonine-protein kinase [Acaryochloris marina]QUY44335.1 AAA family ATPase [Acaryochloris marina S15]